MGGIFEVISYLDNYDHMTILQTRENNLWRHIPEKEHERKCLKIHVAIVFDIKIVANEHNVTWKSDEYNTIGILTLIMTVNPSPHTSESDQVFPFFHMLLFSLVC